MNLFKNLPASMNALLMVMGVLAPLVMLAGASHPELMNKFLLLYLIIGVVAGLGVFTFERKKKKKSKEFSDGVQSNASNAEGIRDPNMIAQMDHMRKEFQRGIDIYQKHGKSLYSLPWYVVVGESESGKTEMIRRSEIGFPDKLQDRWQGSGGTLSMHWWFTNKAVILDTAGRLFVSEGAEGGQSQWTNFLQMLKKNRPDCPINGLIMVIPASRLLHHPDRAIEEQSVADLDRNAGQIARQMETISNELGIRFPVYIMITKMDKVKGFREFFSDVDKAEERYQMLGWSNPAQAGDPFEPQAVADYMHSVSERLNRRMMSSLRQVEPAEPQGIRMDEVDSLYAFPVSFQSMAPKLTRYLRHIFTSDEWSVKPPFLRGIYFTSALQQGTVLDEALAAAMGVTFDKMAGVQEDDGLSLSKNRTYFVRDLFLDKIFQEKGLVSTTGKMKSKISGWKFWAPAMILAALALFGLLGLYSVKSENEVKEWNTLWQTDDGSKDQRIIPLARWEDNQIKPTKPEAADKMLRTLGKLGNEVQGQPKLGWVFKPAQLFDRNLAAKRKEVYSDLVVQTLAQLETATIQYLSNKTATEEWTEDDWQALHALVILRNSNSLTAGHFSENASTTDKTSAGIPEKGLSGKNWDSSTVTIDDDEWDTVKLYGALLKVANLNIPTAHLDFCLARALQISRNNFQGLLKDHRKSLLPRNDSNRKDGVFDRLVKKMMPKDDLKNQKKYIDQMNNFAKELDKASNLIDFMEACKQIPEDGSIVSGVVTKDDSEDDENDDVLTLADSKELFAAAIFSTESLKEHYKVVEVEPGQLDAYAEMIHNNQMLMKHLRIINEVFVSPNTLKENYSDFMQPLEDLCEDEDTKKEVKAKFSKIRKYKEEWLNKEFIPKEFHKHLHKPFVEDGTSPSVDGVVFMRRINEIARESYPSRSEYKNLGKSMDFFIEKVEGDKVTFREMKLTQKRINESEYEIIAILLEGQESGKFDAGDGTSEYTLVSPDQTIELRVKGSEQNLYKIAPWEIYDSIKIDAQSSWKIGDNNFNGKFFIEISNGRSLKDLNDRPSIEDFRPKP